MLSHKPVLVEEVIDYLDPKPNENFIDCTFGGGGHGLAILDHIQPKGRILGIEADNQTLLNFKAKAGELTNLILVNDNFVNLSRIYEYSFNYPVHGILFDLGFSTLELEDSGRGFSFERDEPLDMRFDPSRQQLTAGQIINYFALKELEKIFREYGEYPKAFNLAKAILERRKNKKIQTTKELAALVKSIRGGKGGRKKVNPVAQVFQALRISVNQELDNLGRALPQALDILEPHGRVAVISFHSLEDRLVKNFFRDLKKSGKAELLVKKPIVPSHQEIRQNSKSRSAKMRVIKKVER